MPSTVTHLMVGLVGGRVFAAGRAPMRYWVLSAFCAVLPDLDVVGFRLEVAYGDFWGHRGFSHSILFALLVGVLVTYAFFPRDKPFKRRGWLVLYFAGVTVSNGVFDALTNGGLGIAFFAPFDNGRYFFPWRPITVSPIGIEGFFSEWGLRALLSELAWVWLPLLAVLVSAMVIRELRRSGVTGGSAESEAEDT